MKHLSLIFFLSCLAFGQGVILPTQQALKVVNGITSPVANATITVCAANTSGIPCSPVLVSAVFKDAALTQPLTNPFTSDANGNYVFAIAPGNYTVTVTGLGFVGYSYQTTAPLAAAASNTFTNTNTFNGTTNLNGAANLTGGGTITGGFSVTAKNLNNIQFADQFAGGDCGAKVNAADAALGANAGIIYVNLPACGTAWTTLVSLGGNGSGHVLKFIGGPAPLSFSTSAGISIDGGNSGMDGLTTAVNNVSITAANGSNIPWVIRMNAGGVGLSNLKVDGNFANNPTGGVDILVTNSAPQTMMSLVTVTGAPGYGIYSNTNAGFGAGSFDGHLDNVRVTTNQGGGILLRNTNDWMVQHTPIDINGAIGTVNTTNSAVSTCPSNCVTQQTGGKWTTDSSMVGVKMAIGANAAGTHPTYYTVTNIYSTTLLQVSPAPGTQTGSAFGLGAAVELSDSPGFRLIHADIGLAGSCGIWMYGTAANKTSSNEIIGPANQFGNTNNDDICIFGYDTVGGNYAAGGYTTIQGNNFTGLGVCNANLASCNNKWDHVWVDDPATGLQIVGNNMNSQTGTLTNRAGIETTENLAGEGTKGRPIYNAGNYFGDSSGSNWTYGGAYGTAKIVSNIAQGSSGSVTWTNGEAGSLLAAYGICDEAVNTNPCKWWNVAGGVLQLLNNVGTPIQKMTDAGQLSTSISGGTFFNVPQVIASGTATMTTAAITAPACGTTVTVAAASVATTDTITWAFNAAPAGTNAGIVAWPTSGNVNFAYCPGVTETPAAATINWRVIR